MRRQHARDPAGGLRYGSPPHDGIAFGLDRIAMLMAGADSIRDATLLDRYANALCSTR